jgi:hypothetical protein
LFVAREFPEANWDDFLRAATGLRDVLGKMALIIGKPGPAFPDASTARHKLQGMGDRRNAAMEVWTRLSSPLPAR